ncbi:MAG: prolipoprotein diacylglyceryl transferase [Lentisphaeraceae bacterium]|nr:prolipoprotein diacylglyceryl transferase [Lentisphaeraceae bacterium]
MHPHLFNLFGLEIRSFGLMAATGLLLAFWLMRKRAIKAEQDPEVLSDILFFSMIGSLIGARLLYVIRNYEAEFAGNFIKIFKINEGGIVFQGGFIGGLLVAWFLCKKKNFDFITGLDIIAPCLALGHAMGRIGCFLNGCCYGGICESSLGVQFPKNSLPYMDQLSSGKLQPLAEHSLPVHPTQLYSFAANIVICIILIAVTAKLKIKGHLFSLYLMIYGVWRLSIEFLRDDQDRHLGLSVAQYIAIGQFAVGLALWIYFTKKNSKKEIVLNESAAN